MLPRAAGKGVRPGPGSVVLTRDEACEVGTALWLVNRLAARDPFKSMIDRPTQDSVELAMFTMVKRGAVLPIEPKDEQEGAVA
jgi:hypothetical protein